MGGLLDVKDVLLFPLLGAAGEFCFEGVKVEKTDKTEV
jgi:hypothetical protein